jgi:hypothetical protein
MERYNLRLARGKRPAFNDVPAHHRRRVFGVDYTWVQGQAGGEMFFTRHGWAIAESILPQRWFDKGRYCSEGEALVGGTGAVYHLPVRHPVRPIFSVVVKFCRFAQHLGVTALASGEQFGWPRDLINSAGFLDPFSEFANVLTLRERAHGRVRTKHPLAIYCPPSRYSEWQLGRDPTQRWSLEATVDADQAQVQDCPRIRLEWERVYVLLYQWIEGIDLEEAVRNSQVSEATMMELTRLAAREVVQCGFAVLDHKPRHVIVRPSESRHWLDFHGGVSWALVDYELLVPLPVKSAAAAQPRVHAAAG